MNSAVLTAYDKTNTVIRDVDYIEVQWSRKWKEFGTWSAYMRLEDYKKISAVRFVKLAGRPEIGVRMKTEFEGSVKGDFVTISGLFLHQLLNWASSAMTYYIKSRTELMKYAERTCGSFSTSPADQFVTDYPEDTRINAFWRVKFLNYNPNVPSGITGTIEAKTGVADALMNILGEDCSFYANILRSDYGRIGMEVDFRKGKDRTSLVFSRENGNVSDIRYSWDVSAVCSTVRVRLETDPSVKLGTFGWDEYYLTTGPEKQYTGDTAKNVYIAHYEQGIYPFDGSPGFCEPAITIDGQTSYPLTSANWAKIKSELEEQGKLEGLNHYREKAASFKAIQKSGCQYLTNYDLGDTISIKTPLDSSAYTTRIMGVNEVHKGNVCEVELSTGKIYERRIRYRR